MTRALLTLFALAVAAGCVSTDPVLTYQVLRVSDSMVEVYVEPVVHRAKGLWPWIERELEVRSPYFLRLKREPNGTLADAPAFFIQLGDRAAEMPATIEYFLAADGQLLRATINYEESVHVHGLELAYSEWCEKGGTIPRDAVPCQRQWRCGFGIPGRYDVDESDPSMPRVIDRLTGLPVNNERAADLLRRWAAAKENVFRTGHPRLGDDLVTIYSANPQTGFPGRFLGPTGTPADFESLEPATAGAEPRWDWRIERPAPAQPLLVDLSRAAGLAAGDTTTGVDLIDIRSTPGQFWFLCMVTPSNDTPPRLHLVNSDSGESFSTPLMDTNHIIWNLAAGQVICETPAEATTRWHVWSYRRGRVEVLDVDLLRWFELKGESHRAKPALLTHRDRGMKD